MAVAPGIAAQPPDVVEAHRNAVDIYVRTADVTAAIVPLQHWKPQDFDRAIEGLIASKDVARMRAAAIFHLDIATALVGLSSPAAKQHIEIGSDLLSRVRDSYKEATKRKEHDAFRAIWLSVAGSVFLSIRDPMRAAPYLRQAHDLAPDSAHVWTVYGMVEEVDASGYNPNDWTTLSQRERNQREQIIRLGRAERAYREAIRLDSHYAIALIRLGHVLHISGKLREARESMDRGVAEAKGPYQEYVAGLYMGGLLQDQKDFGGARRSYERALAIVPNSQLVVVALAHLELMAGRPDRAQTLARDFAASDTQTTWWAYKDGSLDLPGLQWLRQQARQ